MHGVIRIIVAVLAALGFLAFFIPLSASILNIGNVTGMIVCALLFGYMLFFNSVNNWVVRIWQYTSGRVFLIIAASLLAIAVVTVIVISVCMISASVRTPTEEATVVVLGCKVNGESPSLMLRKRLDAATDYLKAHPGAACVVSGGQGNGEAISEAECMKRYLIAEGIEESRIYMEDRSTSTRENLTFSREIIGQNDLNPSIAIVTNEFHQYRAAQIARSLNMEAYAVSASSDWLFPTYYFREIFAILHEWIF